MMLNMLSGCATMVQKSATNLLYVNSDPPGAQVTLSTGVKGITPCQFELPGKAKLMVVIEKEGYEQVEVVVQGIITPKKFLSIAIISFLFGIDLVESSVSPSRSSVVLDSPKVILNSYSFLLFK